MADDTSNDSLESEDEEYVPEGASSSASEASEGEWTPGGVVKRGRGRRSSKPTRRSSRRSVASIRSRSRRGGIKLTKYESSDEDNEEEVGDESEESGESDSSDGGEAHDSSGGIEAHDSSGGIEAHDSSGDGGEARNSSVGGEAPGGDNDIAAADISLNPKEKTDSSRIDDLWASFKQDVGIPSKGEKVVPTSIDDKSSTCSGTVQTEKNSATAKEEISNTVSIKTRYDFAGEEVEVEKKVQAGSKEAKEFFESQSSTQSPGESGSQKSALLTGTKRKGSGLGSVLQSIGKKQKMSTLEKSRLDWQQFKSSEGLEDELAHSTDDGYLAKQEFLQRADQRQFELEREERLKRFKKLH